MMRLCGVAGLLAVLAGLASCSLKRVPPPGSEPRPPRGATPPAAPEAPSGPYLAQLRDLPLKEAASRRRILAGAWGGHAADGEEADPERERLMAREFDVEVLPVEMAALHPEPDRFDFQAGLDPLIDRLQTAGLQPFLSSLLARDEALPAWLAQGEWTRETLMPVLENWIKTAVGRYRGRALGWVVVDRPLGDGARPELEDNLWRRFIGDDYLDLAFRWAREADPQAKLYLTEAGAESLSMGEQWMWARFGALVQLLRGLIERGAPVDGVGFPMTVQLAGPRWSRPRNPAGVAEVLGVMDDVGVDVAFIEMEIAIDGAPGAAAERLRRQADLYHRLLSVGLNHPSFKMALFGGACDAATRANRRREISGGESQPVLFDVRHRPKPAYYAVKAAFLEGDWVGALDVEVERGADRE